MEVEYVRNLNHNYVKLQAKDEFFEYQVQMITRNKIDGLLGCMTERVDNRVDFLYEISSKQPFEQVYQRKKMSYDDFKAFITYLKNIVENIGEYLLDMNSIVLLPELIFMNPEKNDIQLIYLPGAWRDIKEEFHELSRKILDWVDYNDQRAVSAVYELFRKTTEENYSLEEILLEMEFCDNKDGIVQEIISKQKTENEEIILGFEDESEKEYNQDYSIEKEGQKEEQKQSFIKKLAKPVISVAESFIRGLSNDSENVDSLEEDEYDEIVDNVINYNDYARKFSEYSVIAEEETYGNTVFYQSENIKNRELVPYDGNFKRYNLNIFPFIIGKLEEAVDGIINDNSVSRIHAKIEKADGQFFLVDLNSTNGTFLNGKMISPNEKTKLQTGDRIQFGFVEYHFENAV